MCKCITIINLEISTQISHRVCRLAATHCNALEHTATHCNKLQHIARYCMHNDTRLGKFHANVPLRVCRLAAAHCHTLPHSATHCNTLQHTASHHNVSHCITLYISNTRLKILTRMSHTNQACKIICMRHGVSRACRVMKTHTMHGMSPRVKSYTIGLYDY